MTFRVGQEVVCVDDSTDGKYMPKHLPPALSNDIDGLVMGRIYTVRGFCDFRGFEDCIYLEEIIRGQLFDFGPSCEIPYNKNRFRPIVKTDISIFTAMLAPSPKQAEKVE